MQKRHIIVAITGASGAIYGLRTLQHLRALPNVESHLIVSAAGWLNIYHELKLNKEDIRQYADHLYSPHEIGAVIASGSFQTEGMIIAPCSMKTLASIAHGYSDNLISRAADVILKERRRLLLMVRETPFHLIHLRNMTSITEMGGVIFPPLPAFYHHPSNIDEMVDQGVTRVLDFFKLTLPQSLVWKGLKAQIKNDAE